MHSSLRIVTNIIDKTFLTILALMISTSTNVRLPLFNSSWSNTLIVSLKTSSKALETPLCWQSTRLIDETGKKETALVTATVMDGVTVGAEKASGWAPWRGSW